MTLGERIRALRTKRGFTQEEMAEKLGMNRANFSNYERNIAIPPGDTLAQIADILKTSTDYLLGRTDDPAINESRTHQKEDSALPPLVRAWLRADVSDLTEKEKEELTDDLSEYFEMRKRRLLKERKDQG